MERFFHVALIATVGLLGVLIVGYGRDTGYVLHGWIIVGFSLVALKRLHDTWSETEENAPLEYNDAVIRFGIIAAFVWALIGFTVGDIVAWQLAIPSLNGDMSWSNFGRLRPVHTTAVIFGFGGTALIATSFYVVQRTSRARLAGRTMPWLIVLYYNLFVTLAATGYPLGITQAREYAEPEWYADLILLLIWVAYLVTFLRTLARRAEPHIYVANWYYLAFIVVIAMLHVVNNLAVPVSISVPKSYSLFAGVQDAMTQ